MAWPDTMDDPWLCCKDNLWAVSMVWPDHFFSHALGWERGLGGEGQDISGMASGLWLLSLTQRFLHRWNMTRTPLPPGRGTRGRLASVSPATGRALPCARGNAISIVIPDGHTVGLWNCGVTLGL